MLAWMGGTNAQHARLREQLSIDTVTRLFAVARPTALETVSKFVVCPSSRRPVTSSHGASMFAGSGLTGTAGNFSRGAKFEGLGTQVPQLGPGLRG